MSGIVYLRQRKSVHLMCDAAAYDADGVLCSVDLQKCFPIAGMAAAIACTGPALLTGWLGAEIAKQVDTFDALVGCAETLLPALFNRFADTERGGDANSTIILVGWHSKAKRPAAYAMDVFSAGSSRIAKVLTHSPNADVVAWGKLQESILGGSPLPSMDLVTAAGLSIPDDENTMRPERDLLHLLEVMRREEIAGHYWVGGNALLTTVDRRGVSQRIVHYWDEDRVGEAIDPVPIDWSAWRLVLSSQYAVKQFTG